MTESAKRPLTYDCAIIGGGVIGLSLAYELSAKALKIAVVDVPKLDHQASWAAAGILPPADLERAPDPYEKLRAISRVRLHEWCESLKSQTGIDPEYRTCGAIHLARSRGELAALSANVNQWQREGIKVERVAKREVHHLDRLLAHLALDESVLAIFHVPDEACVRPPRLLKALRAACQLQSVQFIEEEFKSWAPQTENQGATLPASAITNQGTIHAGTYCVAAGAWSEPIAKSLATPIEITPWRGQMVMLECGAPPTSKVIYQGPNYVVPRLDGKVLIGSTMEEVGLTTKTTDEAALFLRQFGNSLIPSLQDASELARWAGVRPGTPDGMPFLGRASLASNVFIATGHLRSGIALAAGTAIVMSQLMSGKRPPIDIDAFRPDR